MIVMGYCVLMCVEKRVRPVMRCSQHMPSAQMIAKTNVMKYPFIGVSAFFNGNVPGSPMNMGEDEISWVMNFWKEARLDRWIPAPTQVGIEWSVARGTLCVCN